MSGQAGRGRSAQRLGGANRSGKSRVLVIVMAACLLCAGLYGGVAAAAGSGHGANGSRSAARAHAPAASANASTTTLGIASSQGAEVGLAGFGEVKPSSIALSGAGDTSSAYKITWQSWGGQRAIGHGVAGWTWPGWCDACGTVGLKATVVAYDLRSCDGHPAYDAVQWYFPERGQSFSRKLGTDSICKATHTYPRLNYRSHACGKVPSAGISAISQSFSSCGKVRQLLHSSVFRRHYGHNARFELNGWWCGSELSMQIGTARHEQNFSCVHGDLAYASFNVSP